MHTKDAITFALTVSNRAVLSVIDEMSGAPTTFPTPNGGCHPLWVLGHLALVEGMIPAVAVRRAESRGELGTSCSASSRSRSPMPAAYPPFAEVRDMYVRLRERNLALLESLSEADLDKPTVAPPKGREREFATYGSSFLVLALHQMLHRSHVTDARRAARVAA